jgi:uncharacterized protein (DUF885 family)
MPTPVSPLHQLFQDHWDAWMRFDPLNATYVGDQRYNDRLPSATEESYQNWRGQLIDFSRQLEHIPYQALSNGDQLNFNLFKHLIENEIAEIGFKAHRLPISRTAGFHLMFPDVFQIMPFDSPQDYANYIVRLEAFKQYAQENIELMRLGLRTGYLPPQCTLTDLDLQLKAQVVSDPTESVLYQPFRRFPPQFSDADRKNLSDAAEKAIMRSVVAGYQDLRQFVKDEYLPAARESIATAELPNGEEFYTSTSVPSRFTKPGWMR